MRELGCWAAELLSWPLTAVWCWGNGNALETIHYSGVSCCVVHLCTAVFVVGYFLIQQKVSFLSSILATGGVAPDDLDEKFGHKICMSFLFLVFADEITSPL